MSDTLETNPVYFHDCVALGAHTKLPKALMADRTGNYILYYHHKCPFCNTTAGEKEMAPGVTETPTGYSVDITKVEKLYNGN
jgi:hypothetical protein